MERIDHGVGIADRLNEWRVLCRLSSSSVDVGRAFSSRWLGIEIWLAIKWCVRVVVFLSWAINRDLNGDLSSLNLLAIHVAACLLLQLFTSERDETEAATLAWLVAGLELADHKLGDGAEGNLGRGGRVVGEDLKQL